MISVYHNLIDNEVNIRKQEIFERYNRLIQWGRKHPTRFIEKVFKIELLDYQKWIILNTWTAEKAVWVCSRNAGKTFMGAIYLMARALLLPKLEIKIMNVSGKQSFETFAKMENIAKKNIPSLIGASDVFFDELVKSNANTDGFAHDQKGHTCELYNGSKIKAIIGKPTTVVGERSHVNFYDEAGKIPKEFFALTEPFTTQSTDFKTGGNFDASVYPKDIPTQCIYASSAEDVDSHLWEMYKMCAKKMMMGVPGYFCADINCDIPLAPKINGKAMRPLLKQSEIYDALKTNEARAMREYYNIFDNTGGTDALIKRQDILRNERDYLPIFKSEGPEHHYGLFYDPALQQDNSFVLIVEYWKDKKRGWMGKIVNGINLIEKLPNGDKKPLRSPEQLEWIRKLIVAYNGKAPEYENVMFYVDAGAGGGGRGYADNLMLPWTDRDGIEHAGIIDLTDDTAKEQAEKFRQSKDICRIIEPRKWRTTMFGECAEMIINDYLIFPMPVPKRGVWEKDGEKLELSKEELRALLEIDLMKEELVAIVKTKTPSGDIKYGLPPDKARRFHDDRAYTCVLAAHHLAQLRREEILGSAEPTINMDVLFSNRVFQNPQNKQSSNPFSGFTNPFGRRR